jgi:hypothetical protein
MLSSLLIAAFFAILTIWYLCPTLSDNIYFGLLFVWFVASALSAPKWRIASESLS